MLVLVLIAFIAVVIGVPQIIVAMQGKTQRAQDDSLTNKSDYINYTFGSVLFVVHFLLLALVFAVVSEIF